jgi:serine protease
VGYAGIANQVTLLPLKVCWSYWDFQLASGWLEDPGFWPPNSGGCETAGIVKAIHYAADQGVEVINLSLGGGSPSPAEADALRYAVSRGVFVAMSAGNEGSDLNAPQYPAAFANEIDGAVSVGAVTRTLSRATYSNFGPYVELTAPGGTGGGSAGAIWQTVPYVPDLSPFRIAPRFDRYQRLGIVGTSMASPHVAALAALLSSQGITNPAAIEAALEMSARDLGDEGRDDHFGFGLIDARAAIRGIGWGR